MKHRESGQTNINLGTIITNRFSPQSAVRQQHILVLRVSGYVPCYYHFRMSVILMSMNLALCENQWELEAYNFKMALYSPDFYESMYDAHFELAFAWWEYRDTYYS